jgi:type I restriction enzyme M protein
MPDSDEYLIAEYFQAEADEIERLEAQISEAQSDLLKRGSRQEVGAYEPEETKRHCHGHQENPQGFDRRP